MFFDVGEKRGNGVVHLTAQRAHGRHTRSAAVVSVRIPTAIRHRNEPTTRHAISN